MLNQLFSKRAVSIKYPLVLEKVERAIDFIQRRSDANAPIEIDLLFRRVAVSNGDQSLYFFAKLNAPVDGHSVKSPIWILLQPDRLR